MQSDIDALKARIGDRTIIASVSGGKDSAAMCLHLQEMGIPYRAVFLDTGWEHPATYEYLRGPLTNTIGPVLELSPPRQFEALVEHKGMFPSRTIRFCTDLLKVKPMQRHINALVDAGAELVNAVGIRRGESVARSAALEWEWSDGFDCEVWRPLVAWTEADVIAIHHRHGLRPNPLYLMGARRVGCWPCIHASKEELRLVAAVDPDRIDRIRDLEARVNVIATRAAEGRGEKLEKVRAMFQLRGEGGDPANHFIPIDRVIQWARTSHGGKQTAMFQDAPDAGCMRWGLCDTAGEVA